MPISVAQTECIIKKAPTGLRKLLGISAKQKTSVLIEELKTPEELMEFKKYIASMDKNLMQKKNTDVINLVNEGIDEKLQDPDYTRLFRASINGKPCGILSGEIEKDNSKIKDFATWFINPTEKISGIGKSLMAHFLQETQKVQAEKIRLLALPVKDSSCQTFYKGIGFSEVKTPDGDILPNLFTMTKDKINLSSKKISKNTKYKALGN